MTDDVEIVDLPKITLACVRKTSPTDPAQIGKAMGEGYGEVWRTLSAAGVAPTGMPIAAHHSYSENEMVFDCALPISPADAEKMPSTVNVTELLNGKALKLVHKGPYAGLGKSYEKLQAYYEEHALSMRVPCYEFYMNDPGETAEEDLLTEILMPFD